VVLTCLLGLPLLKLVRFIFFNSYQFSPTKRKLIVQFQVSGTALAWTIRYIKKLNKLQLEWDSLLRCGLGGKTLGPTMIGKKSRSVWDPGGRRSAHFRRSCHRALRGGQTRWRCLGGGCQRLGSCVCSFSRNLSGIFAGPRLTLISSRHHRLGLVSSFLL